MKYTHIIPFSKLNLLYLGKKPSYMHDLSGLNTIHLTKEPPQEEPARQYYFMEKCRERVRRAEPENSRPPAVCIRTFGCQMNVRHEKESAII